MKLLKNRLLDRRENSVNTEDRSIPKAMSLSSQNLIEGKDKLSSAMRTITGSRFAGKYSSETRLSKVCFDSKSPKVNLVPAKQESVIEDPMVNEFPNGMPRKRLVHRELLQEFINGNISMRELIERRNKKSMHAIVHEPFKESSQNELSNQDKLSQAFWEQIQQIRNKRISKMKNEGKRQQNNMGTIEQAVLEAEPTADGVVREPARKSTRFGTIIFDKILSRKDKDDQRKMKESQYSSSLLSQIGNAQQEIIAKIKSGDLIQNDLSHRYYVKQFVHRKNLAHMNVQADVTSLVESQIAGKTVKQLNEDVKLEKMQIAKATEEAADDFLAAIIEKKKSQQDKISVQQENLEFLKTWRADSTKNCLKEQKQHHKMVVQIEKQQKEAEQLDKKARIAKSKTLLQGFENNSNSAGSKQDASSHSSIGNQLLQSAGDFLSLNTNQLNHKSSMADSSQSNSLSLTQRGKLSAPLVSTPQQILTSLAQSPQKEKNYHQKPKTYLSSCAGQNSGNFSGQGSQNPQNQTTTNAIGTNFPNQTASSSNLLKTKSTCAEYDLHPPSFEVASPVAIEKGLNSKKLNFILSKHHSASKLLTNSQGSAEDQMFKRKLQQSKNPSCKTVSGSSSGLKEHTKQSLSAQKSTTSPFFDTYSEKEKMFAYLSHSKEINAKIEQTKPRIFLKDVFDLYSQEEIYRNSQDLRQRTRIHATEKDGLQHFYKTDYDYKKIKHNTQQYYNSAKTSNSCSKLEGDLEKFAKSSRSRNETTNSTLFYQQNSIQAVTSRNSLPEEDKLENCSESGDLSLPSITEAQLDSLYSQSRHIQQGILKSESNPQLFVKRMKSVIKLKEISQAIDKAARIKFTQKSFQF